MRPNLLYSLLFLCLFTSGLHAQPTGTDSLELLMQTAPTDTARVRYMNQLALRYQFADPDKARLLAGEAVKLAAHAHFDAGLAQAHRIAGILEVDQSQFDSASFHYQKALELVEGKKDHESMKLFATLQQNIGVIYHYQENYGKAVEYYLKAARLFTEIGEDGMLFYTYNNLSNVYAIMLDKENSLRYAYLTWDISTRLKDSTKIGFAGLAVASARMELKHYDAVEPVIDRTEKIAREASNYYMMGKALRLKGQYLMDGKHDLRAASIAMKESLDALQKAGNEYEIASQLQALAESLSRYGRHDEARKYLLQSLEIARRTDNRQVEKYSLQNLADVEERTGHLAAALDYLRQFIIVNDTINLRANQKQVNALETKYGSEIKEYKINQLQKEKQIQAMSLSRKSIVNYILFGSMLLLIALGSLAWRNFRKTAQLSRQQKALDEQRIRELERSRQFVAVEALLKGQEEERVRVAKDLHDGMGGMLSGVKYSLLHLQQQTTGQTNDFEGPIQALDRSITELRRVAHNMMPDALVRFGLDEALRDFCTSFHSVGVLGVRYQSFGMERRIDPSREIVLYRIVQELLNNAIKHAEATEILVQLVQSGERLSITVEDNGVGFVPAKMEEGKGAGWKNIRSRVDYLKGRLDIDSQPGSGTSVFIEVNT